MVEFQDQNADGLRLYLATGEVDPQQFNRLVIKEGRFGLWSVNAAIIGASHHVVFEIGKLKLNEVLACVTARGGNVLTDSSLGEILGTKVSRNYEGLHYQCLAHCLTWSQGSTRVESLEEKIVKAKTDDTALGLRFDFPTQDPDEPTPKTLVLVSHVNEFIGVESIHSYPQHDQVVVTSTIVRTS